MEFRPDGTENSTLHTTLGSLSMHQTLRGTYKVNGDQLTVTDRSMTGGLDASTQKAVEERTRQLMPPGSSVPIPSSPVSDYSHSLKATPETFTFRIDGDTLTLTRPNGPAMVFHRVK